MNEQILRTIIKEHATEEQIKREKRQNTLSCLKQYPPCIITRHIFEDIMRLDT